MKAMTKRALCGLVVTVPTLLPAWATAASVTWQPAFELVNDSNINVLGRTVVYAQNGGDNVGNPAYIPADYAFGPIKTVTFGYKDVAFEGISTVYGAAATFGAPTFGDAVDHLAGQNFNVTFSTTSSRTTPIPQVNWDFSQTPDSAVTPYYGETTGNIGLDSLLDSYVFVDGRSVGNTALNLQLNNLVPGRQYQVQLIGPADTRPARLPTIERDLNIATVNDGAGNSMPDLGAYMDLDGDGARHVTSIIGTFTADASGMQAVNVVLQQGRNHGISAVIVTTDVIEGDVNEDGTVDFDDLGLLLGSYDGPDALADFDADGTVDFDDLGTLLGAYGASVWDPVLTPESALEAVAAVPEPMSAALPAAGAAMLFRRRRA